MKKFSYKKKDGEEREVNLFVLNESDTHMQGIDLSKLTEDEEKTVKVYTVDLGSFYETFY